MPKKKSPYLKIKEAALFFDVSIGTIRSWDRKNKLKAFRGEQNRYRLYLIPDLQKFKEGHKQRKYNRSNP